VPCQEPPAGARRVGAFAAEGSRPLQTRIIGGLGVLWGVFLITHAYRERGHESLGTAQVLSLLLAAVFVVIGLYYVFKGPAKDQSKT